jgi:hypothetical protein
MHRRTLQRILSKHEPRGRTLGGIPLFDGEKQQKTAVPARQRPNATSQVVDSLCAIRNSATLPSSGNFLADQGNKTA